MTMQSCSNLIKPIHTLSLDDTREYGSKAARLGEITRLGYRVPDGICLSCFAFELFLSYNRFHDEIEAILASAKSDEIDKFQRYNNKIVDAFRAGDIPVRIAESILRSWQLLGKVFVAVRSSSTCEDAPDLSFAGQHETFLNIVDEKALLLSVRRCWASLFTTRAIDYAHRHGINLLSCKMGVIIQRMVNASQAGVLFTADPVTGNPDMFVLEVQKGDSRGNHYLSLDPMPEDDIPAEWRQLRDIGLALDEHLSAYQDIEWAIEDGTVFVLQSRPATNIPHYLPMTWRNSADAEHKWELEDEPGVPPRLLQPHTRYHESRSQELIDAFFSKVDKRFLPCRTIHERFVCGYSYRRWEYLDYPTYDDDVSVWKRFWQSLARLRVALYLDKEFRALLRNQAGELEALNHVELSSLSPIDLLQHLERIVNFSRLFHAQCGRLSFTYKAIPDILHLLHRRWFGDEAEFWALLITGEDIVVHRDRELWRLTRETSDRPKQREKEFQQFFRKYRHLFLEGHPLADGLDMLELHENPAAARAAMDAWDADPSFNFDRHIEALLQARKEAEKRVLMKLNPLKRYIYRKLLELSRRYIPVKIDRDAPVFLCWLLERDVVLEVGRRLREEGVIENEKDARFLSKAEIEGWCQGTIESAVSRRHSLLLAHLGEIITERKIQYRRWIRYSPPDVIGADIQAEEAKPSITIDDSNTLNGVGISPGIAAGRARIIDVASEAGKVKKGEILVCREPLFELSPLFGVVGAVVAEEGGMLDHSGILVREYGVPAVFQVPRATNLIRTGEKIVVDGDGGTVRRDN